MTYCAPPLRIRWGFWAMCSAALLAAAVSLPFAFATAGIPSLPQGGQAAAATVDGGASPALAKLAATRPATQVEAIVQFRAGVEPRDARKLVRTAGGRVTGDLHVINGLVARMSASEANRLASRDGVRAVSVNARVEPQTLVNFDPNKMATSFNQSVKASNLWNDATGKGVGVAVIDTGIAGDHPDFRTSQSNSASRVVASVATHPDATKLTDTYGHGTHVAGLIAGNSGYRASSDSLRGKYAGAAPDANLVSIKASDDEGNATVLDVIYGLQFAVDFKSTYNIRVVNLSVESAVAESYKTDPLDAAAEAAWFKGIVVVAAAGNRGTDADAAQYAPGNDPYVISVGAVDDNGTKDIGDDVRASWSTRGTTQDGFAKPDLYAPGAHIISSLAAGSEFASLCPSCIKGDGQYIQAGGTSMSAPIVSGVIASILQKRPKWTPNQVKGAILNTLRTLPGGGKELDAVNAYKASGDKLISNKNLTPNTLVDAATGEIDYTRSRWSRSRWSEASGSLGADWARSRWSCDCYSGADSTTIEETRSRWSRSRWSTSWGL